MCFESSALTSCAGPFVEEQNREIGVNIYIAFNPYDLWTFLNLNNLDNRKCMKH